MNSGRFTRVFFPAAGTGDPYFISRPMTRDFLREDVLRGSEATPENLQRATERILEELQQSFESSFVSLETDKLDLCMRACQRCLYTREMSVLEKCLYWGDVCILERCLYIREMYQRRHVLNVL